MVLKVPLWLSSIRHVAIGVPPAAAFARIEESGHIIAMSALDDEYIDLGPDIDALIAALQQLRKRSNDDGTDTRSQRGQH